MPRRALLHDRESWWDCMGGGHAAPEAETLVVMEPVEEIPADEPGDGGELQELCVQPRHRLTCVCVRGGGFAEGVCWVMQVSHLDAPSQCLTAN